MTKKQTNRPENRKQISLSLSCYKTKYSMHSIWTASQKLPLHIACGSLHRACRTEGTREASIKKKNRSHKEKQDNSSQRSCRCTWNLYLCAGSIKLPEVFLRVSLLYGSYPSLTGVSTHTRKKTEP